MRDPKSTRELREGKPFNPAAFEARDRALGGLERDEGAVCRAIVVAKKARPDSPALDRALAGALRRFFALRCARRLHLFFGAGRPA